jgi:hypothetical protein
MPLRGLRPLITADRAMNIDIKTRDAGFFAGQPGMFGAV